MCLLRPARYNTSNVGTAIAEKQDAASLYQSLNDTAYAKLSIYGRPQTALLRRLRSPVWACECCTACTPPPNLPDPAILCSYSSIAPSMPNATMAKALLVSVEAGAYASGIVAAGWTVMLLGYSGDRSGVYNK